MAKVITTAVIKGGTGKTTTAAALAQACVKHGRKALAVDLDPQGNLSTALGADCTRPGSLELIQGTPGRGLIQHTRQGIDCLAASPDLAALTTRKGSGKRLQEALKPLEKSYTLIVIDTPPQLGELTFNALQAAKGLLIPLQADIFSIQGLRQVAQLARQIQGAEILGAIVCQYSPRTKLKRTVLELIREECGKEGIPFLMAIREGIAVQEALAYQESLFDYAPQSNPAKDYLNLYNTIF